jgi:sulfur carrier protein ThiS
VVRASLAEEKGAAVWVEVVLFGPYAWLLPPGSENGRARLQVEQPASVGRVLDRLEVPPEGRTYVTVNGRHVGIETLLSEGDEIRVVVPLGGG